MVVAGGGDSRPLVTTPTRERVLEGRGRRVRDGVEAKQIVRGDFLAT